MLQVHQARLLLLLDGQRAYQLYLQGCSYGRKRYGLTQTILVKLDTRLHELELMALKVLLDLKEQTAKLRIIIGLIQTMLMAQG